MASNIREVARRAGVALGTVSRVLNGHGNVDAALRLKVERAVEELNYRPSAARRARREVVPVVSFILANRSFLHPVHSQILQGVEEECEKAGYFVLFSRFEYSKDTAPGDLALPRVLSSHGVADCVIAAGTNYENFIRALEQLGAHYVLLANNYVGSQAREPFDQARFDDATASMEATRYLIQLGHRNIWYIGDVDLPWNRTRFDVYAETMRSFGLDPHGQTVALSDDGYTNGFLSVQSLLEQKAPVTAIIAGSDEVAEGVWEALRSAGRQVPRDISLIGFTPKGARLRFPQMTTVDLDARQMGHELARMAIQKLKRPGLRGPEALVPAVLVKRGSCRPVS